MTRTTQRLVCRINALSECMVKIFMRCVLIGPIVTLSLVIRGLPPISIMVI